MRCGHQALGILWIDRAHACLCHIELLIKSICIDNISHAMAQLCVRFHMAYAEHSDTDLGFLYLSGQVSLDTMSTSPSAPVGGTSPRPEVCASQSPIHAAQDDSKLRTRSSSTREVAEPADEDAGNSSLKRPAAAVASDDEGGADDADDKPPRKKRRGLMTTLPMRTVRSTMRTSRREKKRRQLLKTVKMRTVGSTMRTSRREKNRRELLRNIRNQRPPRKERAKRKQRRKDKANVLTRRRKKVAKRKQRRKDKTNVLTRRRKKVKQPADHMMKRPRAATKREHQRRRPTRNLRRRASTTMTNTMKSLTTAEVSRRMGRY